MDEYEPIDAGLRCILSSPLYIVTVLWDDRRRTCSQRIACFIGLIAAQWIATYPMIK